MEGGALIPRIVQSDDGSHTLKVHGLNEHYHSHKGAIREGRHVFLENGLAQFGDAELVRLLEVGFGTGLNALLTLLLVSGPRVKYTALETNPLSWDLLSRLNYPDLLGNPEVHQRYHALHHSPWDCPVEITDRFELHKVHGPLQDFDPPDVFDLVYFDAFAPHAQPEMWEPAIWKKLYNMMAEGGIMVTYCAKGQVRRDMQSAGFSMERLAGPPGKREMLRARKI